MSVLDDAFAQLLSAAEKGERCPMSDSIRGGSKSVSLLAREGRILVEVFVHNFRRVTILTGELAGKSTASPPKYHGATPNPYLIIDKRGTFRNGKPVDCGASSRKQPSALRSFA